VRDHVTYRCDVPTPGDPLLLILQLLLCERFVATVNPTIDFNNPAGGSYDVWIGSYAANTTISGTLYLTENSGNHP